MDYSQWYDKWGSWDPYTAIMSEIDDDLEDVLMIIRLLFGENRRLKKNLIPAFTGGLGVSC
jgi:hypothetical protein